MVSSDGVDAVIFDWGGTLTRWHDIDFHAESLALARAVVDADHDVEVSRERLLAAGDVDVVVGVTGAADPASCAGGSSSRPPSTTPATTRAASTTGTRISSARRRHRRPSREARAPVTSRGLSLNPAACGGS